MMKTIILGLMMASCLCVRLNHLQNTDQLQIVGGWSTVDLPNKNNDIDSFIRTKFPELANANLTKAETQVVSGINYRNTYTLDGTTYKVTVWDQSWLNHREVTGIEKITETNNSSGQPIRVSTSTRI